MISIVIEFCFVLVRGDGDGDGRNPTDVTTIIVMSDATTTEIMVSVVSSK